MNFAHPENKPTVILVPVSYYKLKHIYTYIFNTGIRYIFPTGYIYISYPDPFSNASNEYVARCARS